MLRASVLASQRAYRARTVSVDIATTPLITRRKRGSSPRKMRQLTRPMNWIRVNNQLNKSYDQSCDMHSVRSIILDLEMSIFSQNLFKLLHTKCELLLRLSKMCHSIGYQVMDKIVDNVPQNVYSWFYYLDWSNLSSRFLQESAHMKFLNSSIIILYQECVRIHNYCFVS